VPCMAPERSAQTQLFFRLCSDHLSIEAIPKKHVTMDFNGMKDTPPHDCELLMWTPEFVVLKNMKGHEITVRKDGRMIIRKASSESAAKTSAAETWEALMNRNG